MEQNKDMRVEVARLQKEIQDRLGLSSENLVFEYTQRGENAQLDLVTINPRHHQSFLLHTTRGVDRLDALQKMADYVRSRHDEEDTYTIQWTVRGDNQLHTSYFRARDIYGALDKLYYGRDMNNIKVFVVQLNPIA